MMPHKPHSTFSSSILHSTPGCSPLVPYHHHSATYKPSAVLGFTRRVHHPGNSQRLCWWQRQQQQQQQKAVGPRDQCSSNAHHGTYLFRHEDADNSSSNSSSSSGSSTAGCEAQSLHGGLPVESRGTTEDDNSSSSSSEPGPSAAAAAAAAAARRQHLLQAPMLHPTANLFNFLIVVRNHLIAAAAAAAHRPFSSLAATAARYTQTPEANEAPVAEALVRTFLSHFAEELNPDCAVCYYVKFMTAQQITAAPIVRGFMNLDGSSSSNVLLSLDVSPDTFAVDQLLAAVNAADEQAAAAAGGVEATDSCMISVMAGSSITDVSGPMTTSSSSSRSSSHSSRCYYILGSRQNVSELVLLIGTYSAADGGSSSHDVQHGQEHTLGRNISSSSSSSTLHWQVLDPFGGFEYLQQALHDSGVCYDFVTYESFLQYQPGTSCCHILLLLLAHVTNLLDFSSPDLLQQSYMDLLRYQPDPDVAVSCFARLLLEGKVEVGLMGVAMWPAAAAAGSSEGVDASSVLNEHNSSSSDVAAAILDVMWQSRAPMVQPAQPATAPAAAAAEAASPGVASAAAAAAEQPQHSTAGETAAAAALDPVQQTAEAAPSALASAIALVANPVESHQPAAAAAQPDTRSVSDVPPGGQTALSSSSVPLHDEMLHGACQGGVVAFANASGPVSIDSHQQQQQQQPQRPQRPQQQQQQQPQQHITDTSSSAFVPLVAEEAKLQAEVAVQGDDVWIEPQQQKQGQPLHSSSCSCSSQEGKLLSQATWQQQQQDQQQQQQAGPTLRQQQQQLFHKQQQRLKANSTSKSRQQRWSGKGHLSSSSSSSKPALQPKPVWPSMPPIQQQQQPQVTEQRGLRSQSHLSTSSSRSGSSRSGLQPKPAWPNATKPQQQQQQPQEQQEQQQQQQQQSTEEAAWQAFIAVDTAVGALAQQQQEQQEQQQVENHLQPSISAATSVVDDLWVQTTIKQSASETSPQQQQQQQPSRRQLRPAAEEGSNQQQQAAEVQGYASNLDMTDLADILTHYDGYVTSDGHLIYTTCSDVDTKTWFCSSAGVGVSFYKAHGDGVHWVDGAPAAAAAAAATTDRQGAMAAAEVTGSSDNNQQQVDEEQEQKDLAISVEAVFAAIDAGSSSSSSSTDKDAYATIAPSPSPGAPLSSSVAAAALLLAAAPSSDTAVGAEVSSPAEPIDPGPDQMPAVEDWLSKVVTAAGKLAAATAASATVTVLVLTNVPVTAVVGGTAALVAAAAAAAALLAAAQQVGQSGIEAEVATAAGAAPAAGGRRVLLNASSSSNGGDGDAVADTAPFTAAAAAAAGSSGCSEIILHRSGYHFTLTIVNHQHKILLHFNSLGIAGNTPLTVANGLHNISCQMHMAAAAVVGADPPQFACTQSAEEESVPGLLANYTVVGIPAVRVQNAGYNTCGAHVLFVALAYVADICGFRSACAAGSAAAVQGALQQCYQQLAAVHCAGVDWDLVVSRVYRSVVAAAATGDDQHDA